MNTRIAVSVLLCSACVGNRSSTPLSSPQASVPRAFAPPESAVSAPDPAPDFDWPVPGGWKHETIPFPLGFAPEIPFRGLEELRFTPGFSTPSASTYWSYDFVWWLEEPPVFDARSISAVLGDYFRGLVLAVGKDKFAFDPAHFRAELALTSARERQVLVGQVHSYDPFVTGLPIVLNVEATLRSSPTAAHTAIAFLISPKPMDDPVWIELRACMATMRCK